MKQILLTCVFMYLSLLSGAQTVSKVVTISNSDVQLSIQEGYTHVNLKNGTRVTDVDHVGKPDLPIIFYKFIIPANKTLTSVQLSGIGNQTISSSCLVYPMQNPHIDSLENHFIEPDTNIYHSSQTYPPSNILLDGLGQFREYKIVHVGVMPFSYSPTNNSLELTYQFEITINYETDTNALVYKRYRKYHEADQRAYDYVYSVIENKNDLGNFYGESVNKLQSLTDNSDISFFGFRPTKWPSTAGSLVEMVIVTNNYDTDGNFVGNLTSGFETYAEWKTKMGIPTIVMSISDIKEHYKGWDTQEQIRNFLIEAHEKWNTEYVILGGDISIVPTREYGSQRSFSILSYTDTYYGDINDGTTLNNWNKQPDYVFSGKNDNGKINMQDISFGRIYPR